MSWALMKAGEDLSFPQLIVIMVSFWRRRRLAWRVDDDDATVIRES